MNKYKKVIFNTGTFFLGTFGSRVISFLLVRFYTELLTTAEYGMIDIMSTTASLVVPIVTLSITEAVLRFCIDDEPNRSRIFSTGLGMILFGNLLFLLTIPIFSRIRIYDGFLVYLYLLILSDSLYRVTAHFARGCGKSKLFAFSGVLHTFLLIGMNILFLLVFRLGVSGYLLSMIISNVITMLYVGIFGQVFRNIEFKIDFPYLKEMLKYSLPIVPNTLLWWVAASSDRYIILAVLGIGMNGIYTAASKIPNLITNLGTVFLNAWQLSCVEEAKSESKNEFFTNVMHAGATFLFLISSLIMVVIQPLYHVFVGESYYEGWQVVPLLTLSMFFGSMSSFVGTNYFAMKKTAASFYTMLLSAIVNFVLNIILTPIWGIRGTALATAISFAVTWIVRSVSTRKFVMIKYDFKSFIFPLMVLIVQALLLTIGVRSIVLQVCLMLVIVIACFKTILKLLQKGLQMIKRT